MTTAEKRELLLKEWELAGGEQARKGILKKLSDKYQVPEGTVRRWKSEYLKKNKVNVRNNKRNERTKMANERELNINQDILNGATKKEIMSTYGISERTYHRKTESIRALRLEITKEYQKELIEEVYGGKLKDILKNGERAKANLTIKTITELKSDNVDYKKIESNEKAFNSITKMLNNLARNGDILSVSQMNEIEAQLVDENIKNEYLQLEKEKNKIVDTDNKIEIDLKGV